MAYFTVLKLFTFHVQCGLLKESLTSSSGYGCMHCFFHRVLVLTAEKNSIETFVQHSKPGSCSWCCLATRVS